MPARAHVVAAAVVLALAGGACDRGAPRRGGASPAGRPTTAPPGLTAAQWQADLAAFVRGLEQVHPNPWWRVSESAFKRKADALAARLATLDPVAARVAVLELAALIDGHTAVYPTDLGFHYYAIELYEFTDGIYVLAAPGHEEAVGGRLTAIGGVPVAEAVRRVSPLVSRDNDESLREGRPLFLVCPEALRAKGIVADEAHPAFHVTKDGTTLTLDPERLTWEDYQRDVGWFPVGLPKRPEPMFVSRRDEPFWTRDLGDGVLYVQYNQVASGVGDVAAEVTAAAARPGFRRVVVDMRHNGGGDNNTYGPLLDALRGKDVDRPGRLVVLIGRATFSAAANFATEVERSTGAVFAGEPTGGRPNLYGDVSGVTLPRSGLVVHVSARYWQKSTAGDRRPAIPPDVPVRFASRDWFAHRDPVLAAALAYRV